MSYHLFSQQHVFIIFVESDVKHNNPYPVHVQNLSLFLWKYTNPSSIKYKNPSFIKYKNPSFIKYKNPSFIKYKNPSFTTIN
jgi:hypothetical protein